MRYQALIDGKGIMFDHMSPDLKKRWSAAAERYQEEILEGPGRVHNKSKDQKVVKFNVIKDNEYARCYCCMREFLEDAVDYALKVTPGGHIQIVVK